eukprot:1223911-Pyramimonas_sp.AAC.1
MGAALDLRSTIISVTALDQISFRSRPCLFALSSRLRPEFVQRSTISDKIWTKSTKQKGTWGPLGAPMKDHTS